MDIVSVNVSRPKVLLRWSGGEVVSSIDKTPVEAAEIALTRSNLDGDLQADRRPLPGGGQVHGGPHQALYAFPSEHFRRLSRLLGRAVGPGYMGENLTLRGATEGDVCIGDIWRWGTARVQVSAPRGPCYKLGIRMGRQALRTAVREEGLVGWYLRVLVPGTVPTSGHIERESRDADGITVADIQAALNDRANVYPDLAALAALSPPVRRALTIRGRDLSGGVPEAD
jgi:MOSC domain-containing protein YiiM